MTATAPITEHSRAFLALGFQPTNTYLTNKMSFKIVSKLDPLAVHSVGYYSREKAEKVAANNPGKHWTDKRLGAGEFIVVEEIKISNRR